MSFKGNLKLMFLDAGGQSFSRPVTVDLKHTVLDRRKRVTVNPGEIKEVTGLESTHNGRYEVRCMAEGHHTVAQFAQVLEGRSVNLVFSLPIKPSEVKKAHFRPFKELDASLKKLLQNSPNVEGCEGKRGTALYEALQADPLRCAGLLNIHAKMRATRFPNPQTSVADFIAALTRVRSDRFFAEAALPLRDEVKSSMAVNLFRKVDGSLHTPPPNFQRDDSFKTNDLYGNLQVTFFRKDNPLQFLVDVDIDEASGLEHAFDVIGHAFSGGTHPYDIHQILLAQQIVNPGYELELET